MKKVITLALTAVLAVAMSTATFAQDCGCAAPAPAAPMMAAPIQSYAPAAAPCTSCGTVATVAYNEVTPTTTPIVTSAPIQATPVSTYNTTPVYAQPATSGCCGSTPVYNQPAVTYQAPVATTPVTTQVVSSPVTTAPVTTSYVAPQTWSTGTYYNSSCNTCEQSQRGFFRGGRRILNRR